MGSRGSVYLVLAIIGAIVPVVLVGVYLADDAGDMVDAIFGNALSAAVMADLAISSVVFWVWLFREAPRIGVSPWPLVAGNILLGLSFALPFFLYLREKRGNAVPAAA